MQQFAPERNAKGAFSSEDPTTTSEQVLSPVATATTAIRSRIRLALSTRQPWASALAISLGCGLGIISP
jgi:hypothetical protein